MKTDDLISAIAADAGTRRRSAAVALSVALGVGFVVAALTFFATLGVRTDIGRAITTWRFDLKLALMAVALVMAAIDCYRLARPTARGAMPTATLVVVPLLAVAVIAELGLTPRAEWMPRLVGTNAYLCLASIPALATFPLAALIWAMRSGAPRSPSGAGAAVGLLAAAASGLLYATHCFDDSPLFVAVWYTLAAVIVTCAGAIAGSRLLRW